jgi:hypothetical protein
MFLPMTSVSPLLRRGFLPTYGSSYGLLDALDQPQLVPIADVSQPGKPTEVPLDSGISPLRWIARQVGLLDALNDTGTPPATTKSPGQGAPRFIGRYPVRSEGNEQSEGSVDAENQLSLSDIGKLVADPFVQAGKDLWTGYLIGASGMYDTAGDAVGLLNRANDFMTQWTGVGQMSEGTIWKDAKDWLHDTAIEVAPRSEDLPTSIPGKIYAGIGQAPAELAQLLTAARLVGPVAGLAGLEGVRASENGWAAAGEAAAKGALFGLAAKALDPLNWIARSAGLASLGAASSVAEGQNSSDAIASAASLGLLGAFGVPRAKQPNLVPLQVAYSDFNEAANHAQNSLDVVRGLLPRRRRQEVVQINRRPGLLLQDVARQSDELLGYKTTPGVEYELPPSPRMQKTRICDYGRSKRWKRFEDVEVKRENAKYPPEQEFADEYRKSEGARVDLRRENEILKQARIQLGKEGRFDAEAKRLAQIIRQRSRGRGRPKSRSRKLLSRRNRMCELVPENRTGG